MKTTQLPLPLLAIFFCVVSIFGIFQIRYPLWAPGKSNIWDPQINSITSPYLFCYLIAPVSIGLVLFNYASAASIQNQFRYGSRGAWALVQLKSSTKIILAVLATCLLASLPLSAGLPLSLRWSPASVDASQPVEALAYLSSIVPMPLAAIGIQLGLMVVFLVAVSSVLCAVLLVVGNMRRTAAIAVGMWLWLIISWWLGGSLPPSLPLVAYANVTTFPSTPVGIKFAAPAVVLLGSLAITIVRDRRQRRLVLPSTWLVKAAYIAIVLYGTLQLYRPYQSETSSFADALALVYYGRSEDGSNFIFVLFHGIVFIGFPLIWLIGISEGRFSQYLILRHKSVPSFAYATFGRYILGCLGLLLGTLVALYLVRLGIPSNHQGEGADFERTLYHFIVNGLLQLSVYFWLVVLLIWLRESIVDAAFGLAVLFTVSLYPARFLIWPTSYNSLGLSLNWNSSLMCTLCLAFFLTILVGSFHATICRRPLPAWRT